MDSILHEIKEMEEWLGRCYKRSDLHDFHTLMELGIEIGNYLRKLLVLSIFTLTEDEQHDKEPMFDLHDAVIVGHLVRIYKLFDQLVYFVAESKGEISQIFYRPMFETFVIMKYLILRGRKSIDSFIKTSFKSAIEDFRYIKNLEPKRPLSDIEKRIISKIENRIRHVNLNPAELLKNKNWKLDGLSFRGILDYLSKNDSEPRHWGLSYSFLYGSSSSYVHGSWYDIQINHITESNGRYSPKVTYDHVDPRYILPQGFIPIMACTEFLKWRKSDPDGFLIGIFDKIGELLVFLNNMDEIRIAKKGGGT